MPTIDLRHNGITLSDHLISPDMVAKKLKKLKPTKSAGPDGLYPRVLTETADTICYPLAIVFTKSLEEGHLPKSWKMGHITPIRKTTPGNYRPVSFTAVIGKLMESIIRDQIVHHMMEGNHFCYSQHGFVPGRSC